VDGGLQPTYILKVYLAQHRVTARTFFMIVPSTAERTVPEFVGMRRGIRIKPANEGGEATPIN